MILHRRLIRTPFNTSQYDFTSIQAHNYYNLLFKNIGDEARNVYVCDIIVPVDGLGIKFERSIHLFDVLFSSYSQSFGI